MSRDTASTFVPSVRKTMSPQNFLKSLLLRNVSLVRITSHGHPTTPSGCCKEGWQEHVQPSQPPQEGRAETGHANLEQGTGGGQGGEKQLFGGKIIRQSLPVGYMWETRQNEGWDMNPGF